MNNEKIPIRPGSAGSAISKVLHWLSLSSAPENRAANMSDYLADGMEASLVVVEGLRPRAEQVRQAKMRSILEKCNIVAESVEQAGETFTNEVLVAENETVFRHDWKKYVRGNPSRIRAIRAIPLPLPTDDSTGYAVIDEHAHFQMGWGMSDDTRDTQLYVRGYTEASNGLLYNDSFKVFYTPLALGSVSLRTMGMIESALDASPFFPTGPDDGGWPIAPTSQA